MTRYCFEVELVGATAQEVQNSLPGISYQVIGFTSAQRTSVILTVESDDDEDTVYAAIAKVLPAGTKLHRTTLMYTPVKPNPIGDIALKHRNKNFSPVAPENPKNKP